jgi:hypothetical protein
MREKDLAKVLEDYKALPDAERKPPLPPTEGATPPKRNLPLPPPGGLIVKGYCTYLRLDDSGKIGREKVWYYKQNPDRWPVETQSDFLWLREDEWRSLIPAEPQKGERLDVTERIRSRFFCTIGIDYMEGSVNALPARQTAMSLAVEEATPERISLRLDGHAKLGKEYDESALATPHSRGCEVRVMGSVRYDRAKKAIDRFDLVGVGKAWGSKMDYVRREMKTSEQPWLYGIACELVPGDRPIDRIPPYNMLHYGGKLRYFSE